jgi:hypothetical protein
VTLSTNSRTASGVVIGRPLPVCSTGVMLGPGRWFDNLDCSDTKL